MQKIKVHYFLMLSILIFKKTFQLLLNVFQVISTLDFLLNIILIDRHLSPRLLLAKKIATEIKKELQKYDDKQRNRRVREQVLE